MEVLSLYETVTYTSDVEKGNNLMLTRQTPVETLMGTLLIV